MKLLRFIPIIFTISLLLFSCSEKPSKNETSEEKEKSEIQPQDKTTDKGTESGTTLTLPSTPTSPKATQVTPPGMNPPHGQPGHDCKIAVGAPLNSAPKVTGGSPINQNPPKPPGQSAIPKATQVTPPGMNPPHGQPGHDCKIAVGAPLDGSK